MRVLDLFSGIGGFSLAAHWVGFETAAFCEQDKFCQKVLAKNFPGIPIFDDIKTLKGDQFNGSIDIVCGGFPCQPYSQAGKRRSSKDDRHLWPAMARVIKEVRPRWVIGENTTGIISLELDNILSDLEDLGYSCQTLDIPAGGVGAAHRRQRVWIVAHLNGLREFQPERLNQKVGRWPDNSTEEKLSNAFGFGQQKNEKPGANEKIRNRRFSEPGIRASGAKQKSNASFASRILRGVYGLSPWVDRGLKIKNRPNRIKALGNSIVPQVVYPILKAIAEIEKNEVLPNV